MQSEISRCEHKIEQESAAVKQRLQLQQQIKISKDNMVLLNGLVVYMKENKKELVNYNAERKQKALSAVYSGIYSAKSIIPDTSPVELIVRGENAYLADEEGLNINLLEGSAFRATLSFFIRYVVLSNTGWIPFMLVDEPFTTLSAESSATLSAFLPVLAQIFLIILIEQKDEVFSSAEGVVYDFKKTEGRTRVKRGGAEF